MFLFEVEFSLEGTCKLSKALVLHCLCICIYNMCIHPLYLSWNVNFTSPLWLEQRSEAASSPRCPISTGLDPTQWPKPDSVMEKTSIFQLQPTLLDTTLFPLDIPRIFCSSKLFCSEGIKTAFPPQFSSLWATQQSAACSQKFLTWITIGQKVLRHNSFRNTQHTKFLTFSY